MAESFTVGNVDDLKWIDEATDNVTPATALSWGGDIVKVTPSFDPAREFHRASGSRFYNAVTEGAKLAGFNATCRARAVNGSTHWTAFWAKYGIGSETVLTDPLPTFSTVLGLTKGAVHSYWLFNGCKFNQFSIASSGVGKDLIFGADVYSRWIQRSATKAFVGLQSLTVGDDPTAWTTAYLTDAGIKQINLAAGGLATFYPTDWKLTVSHGMRRQPGHVTGADSVVYGLAAQAITEGDGDVVFECTVPYDAQTFVDAKIANTAITALAIPVGAKTITLSGGKFVGNDHPDLEQKQMDERFTARFNTIAIA